MRIILALIGLVALIAIVAIGFGFVSINQTGTASLPQLKVEGGKLPEFNASVARVDVGTENRTVEVPSVGTTERHVEVPTVNIVKPGDKK